MVPGVPHMLIIAVTGDKGSGKSTLLAKLVAWYAAEGRDVDGFTSEAGDRPVPDQGALTYDLLWPATGERTRFATRIEKTSGIPYVLDDSTLAKTSAWAESLPSGRSLVVLDEFGKLEAEGGGHMGLWPAVAASRPEVVAISVRSGVAEAIAERLGRPFDVVIDAGAPDAWAQLRAACLAHRDWTRVGLFGAASGTLEMTLGAALHGASLPFSGLVMASSQAAVMTWAASGLGARGRVVWVPFIAAGLKALSPAGNRLRPMLAITVQGLLYGGMTRLLGWNRWSVAVASALVGAWAAGQGLVLQYLFVGKELLKAYQWLVGWAQAHWGVSAPAVATAVGAWIALWALVAGVVGAVAFGKAQREVAEAAALARLQAWRDRFGSVPALSSEVAKPSWTQAIASGAKDLARPTFWVPLALVVGIILAAGSPWEAAFWVIARAATVGMLLFTAVRFFDLQGAVKALRRQGQWGPAIALSRAIEEVTRASERPKA